jgi:hypothetical protein
VAFHPVAHGNNHVQVVITQRALYIALALSANCQVFLDSCLRRQLTLIKNTLNMETYVLLGSLKQLAPAVIREYGSHRMLVVHTIGGVIGFWASYVAGVRFTIGASAAVCSLMGALLYYVKSRGGSYGQAIYRQVSGWVVTLFVFGFLVPGINNWGMAAGSRGAPSSGICWGIANNARSGVSRRPLPLGVWGSPASPSSGGWLPACSTVSPASLCTRICEYNFGYFMGTGIRY